jgi:hypothetical protein
MRRKRETVYWTRKGEYPRNNTHMTIAFMVNEGPLNPFRIDSNLKVKKRIIHLYYNVLMASTFSCSSCFSMPLQAHSEPRPLIQFRNHFLQAVGLLGRVISPSQGRYLNTGQHKDRINAYTHQTSMPWVGFELTIRASEDSSCLRPRDYCDLLLAAVNAAI